MTLPRPSFLCSVLCALTLISLPLPATAKANNNNQQLVCDPASLLFGRVIIGQPSTLPATMTNTGSSAVTVTSVKIPNPALTLNNLSLPLTLAAGQSVAFSVTFAPTVPGSIPGSIVFISNASNGRLSVSLGAVGVTNWALTANPPSLNFGNVQTGSSVTLPVALTNAGGSSLTITQGRPSGSGFSVSGAKLPLTLSGGQSYTFSVTFTPQSVGAASGDVFASGSLTPILDVPLTGTGISSGQLADSPATMNFGNVTVGQTASQTGTLTASGTSVTISSASSSNSELAVSGISFPLTLAAGQSVSYTVTFTPQGSGSVSATASFVSNASNSPTVESLLGAGVAAPVVTLSWNASSSPVAGYNVYRGGVSGGSYSKINSGVDPATTYSDSTVASGQTYYYVTTAVDSSGMESSYSNQVQAIIP